VGHAHRFDIVSGQHSADSVADRRDKGEGDSHSISSQCASVASYI
jgi:hypothetical protein